MFFVAPNLFVVLVEFNYSLIEISRCITNIIHVLLHLWVQSKVISFLISKNMLTIFTTFLLKAHHFWMCSPSAEFIVRIKPL